MDEHVCGIVPHHAHTKAMCRTGRRGTGGLHNKICVASWRESSTTVEEALKPLGNTKAVLL